MDGKDKDSRRVDRRIEKASAKTAKKKVCSKRRAAQPDARNQICRGGGTAPPVKQARRAGGVNTVNGVDNGPSTRKPRRTVAANKERVEPQQSKESEGRFLPARATNGRRAPIPQQLRGLRDKLSNSDFKAIEDAIRCGGRSSAATDVGNGMSGQGDDDASADEVEPEVEAEEGEEDQDERCNQDDGGDLSEDDDVLQIETDVNSPRDRRGMSEDGIQVQESDLSHNRSQPADANGNDTHSPQQEGLSRIADVALSSGGGALRSVNNVQRDGDPNDVSVDMGIHDLVNESVVLCAVKSSNKQVAATVKDYMVDIVGEMKGDKETIKQLKESVTELNTTVATLVRMLFNRQNTTNARQVTEVERELIVLPELFNEKLLSAVMMKCFIIHCRKIITASGMTNVVKTGSTFISLVNFSIRPSDSRREKFQSVLGKSFSTLRNGVLLSAILALQTNAFNTFLTDREVELSKAMDIQECGRLQSGRPKGRDSELHIESRLLRSKIPKPRWLRPGYICTTHCEEAAMKAESRKWDEATAARTDADSSEMSVRSLENGDHAMSTSSRRTGTSTKGRSRKKGTDLRREIGVEAATQVYRLITSHLHKGRDAYKLQLFHDVMYVFSVWAHHQNRIKQNTLRIQWMENSCSSFDYLMEIPQMVEVKVQDKFHGESIESEDVAASNMKNVSQFIKEHPEMTLIITHDVRVDGKITSLRFFVSVIEVAAKLVAAFCTVDSNSRIRDILNTHEDSFKVVVVVAHALRSILDRTMKELHDDKSVKWADTPCKVAKKKKDAGTEDSQETTEKSYKYPTTHGLSIEDFLPAPSKQKDTLESMLLTLKPGEFERKHRPIRSFDDGIDNESSSNHLDYGNAQVDDAVITVDETMGVVEF